MASSESYGRDGGLRRLRLEKEIRRMWHPVRDQKKLITCLDAEAGRRFEMLDEDMLQLREDLEVRCSLKLSVSLIIRQHCRS